MLLRDVNVFAKFLETFHKSSSDVKMLLAHDDNLEPCLLSIFRNLKFTTAEHKYTIMETTPEDLYVLIRLKSVRADAISKEFTRIYKINYKDKYAKAQSVTDEAVLTTILLSVQTQLTEITSLTAAEQLKNKFTKEKLSMIINDQKNLQNNQAFGITIKRSSEGISTAAILNSEVTYEANTIGKISLPTVNSNNYKELSCIKKRWLKLKFCTPPTSASVNSRKIF